MTDHGEHLWSVIPMRGDHEEVQLETLERASRLVAADHIVSSLPDHHPGWLERDLSQLSKENLLLEPDDMSRAASMFDAIMHIAGRDAEAELIVLPPDHHVDNELVMDRVLAQTVQLARQDPTHVYVLGVVPNGQRAPNGWILPRYLKGQPAQAVVSILDDVPMDAAGWMVAHGALWNSSIVVSSARALGLLFGRSMPQLTHMLDEHARDGIEWHMSDREMLPAQLDLLRDVLVGSEDMLRVVSVPPCGWSEVH